MNPNINWEIEVTPLPSHDGNRQWIWLRSCQRSNEYSKEGDGCVRSVKFYQQVKSPPGGGRPRHPPTSLQRRRPTSLPRHTPPSQPRSPTDKSKAQPWGRPDGHRSGLPKTITESMPLTNDYQLQDIFSRARAAQTRLNFVSITIFREAHLLDDNEWDETTWLTDTIDDYRRLRPMLAAVAAIHAKSRAEALPPRRISAVTYSEIHKLRVRYWMARRMMNEFGSADLEELRSEARERRKWVNRVSELGTGGTLSVGHSFLLFLLFSSLLYTLLLHWISARYKWRRHGFYHLWISVNGRWSFHVRRIRRKVTLSGTNR